jgi:hypothetical protein
VVGVCGRGFANWRHGDGGGWGELGGGWDEPGGGGGVQAGAEGRTGAAAVLHSQLQIYGGMAGFYDIGPWGCQVETN